MAGEDLTPDIGVSATEMDSATRAGERRHTKATARSLAGIVATKMEEAAAAEAEEAPAVEDVSQVTPKGTKEGVEYVTVEVDPETGEETVVKATEAPAEEEGVQYIEEEVPLAEISQALSDAGIVLDIDPNELPDEALGVYESLTSAILQAAGKSLEREREANDRMLELNDFSERLQNSPDKIMLALAMEKPEVFAKVAGVVERMADDPALKESVIRELESEVRLQEANRIKRVADVETRTLQGRRVAQETLRQAKRYGVSPEVANEYISSQVRANGNWLEVNQVEPLIQKLSGGQKKKIVIRKVRPKKVTPEQAKAVAEANTAPVGGAPAPGATREASPGLHQDNVPKNRGGIFRGLVKQAARRTRTTE